MTGLSPEHAWKIFERMCLIRTVEETIAQRYSEQQMRCPTHLSSGQEGVPAVLSVLLKNTDYAVSTHRGHAHYLGKGGNVDQMIAEIYGKATGCAKGFGGSMHLIDTCVGFMGSTAIVGNTIPIGVGLGLSLKHKNAEGISVVYLGDAATEEGVFYEALNFAVLQALPVLFVCENNFFSVYSPLSVRQPEGRSIHEWVKGIGCPSLSGNGNDAFSLFDQLSQAIKHVRSGQGPMFVEFYTYRHREHCGPHFDDHLGYRPEDDLNHWIERDPLKNLSKELTERTWFTETDIENCIQKTQNRVNEAFELAIKAPFPQETSLKQLVYRNPIR